MLTGEAVGIELPVARLGTRILALLIDIVVQFLLLIALLFALGSLVDPLGIEVDGAAAAAMGTALLVSVFGIWPVAFETFTRGRSPGKFALGLRVVRDDGGPIRFRQAFVRGLVGLALEWPGLFGPLAWILALSTAFLHPAGKRLGDLAAGTLVLSERVPDRARWLPHLPAPLASWAPTLDLTRLGDDLALSVRQFLSRNADLTPERRETLGRQLIAEVAATVTPPPPDGTPGWAYLSAVLAERRAREERRLAERRAHLATVVQTGADTGTGTHPADLLGAYAGAAPWATVESATWAPPPAPPVTATGYAPPG